MAQAALAIVDKSVRQNLTCKLEKKQKPYQLSTPMPIGIPTYLEPLDSLILASLQWPRNYGAFKWKHPACNSTNKAATCRQSALYFHDATVPTRTRQIQPSVKLCASRINGMVKSIQLPCCKGGKIIHDLNIQAPLKTFWANDFHNFYLPLLVQQRGIIHCSLSVARIGTLVLRFATLCPSLLPAEHCCSILQ